MIPWNHHRHLPTRNLFKLFSRGCVTPPQAVKTTQPFKNQKIDLALLQETHSTKITETQWQKSGLEYAFGTLVPHTNQQEQQFFSMRTLKVKYKILLMTI